MSDKELIEEARREESIHDKLGDGFSEGSEERAFYYGHRDRYKRLADAIEVRQPNVIDRDMAIDAIAGGTISVPGGYGVLHGDDAENIVDAIIGLATVPDAATEELLKRVEEAEAQSAEDRVEWQQMKERASQRFNAYQQKKRELRQMEIRAEKAEAERDAAVAAIERVQDTLSLHNPNGRLVKEVLAALDGAPEPDDDPCKAETHSWSHYRPEQIDSYWIRCTRLGKHDEHEDSNTGLNWRSRSPVEGVKP